MRGPAGAEPEQLSATCAPTLAETGVPTRIAHVPAQSGGLPQIGQRLGEAASCQGKESRQVRFPARLRKDGTECEPQIPEARVRIIPPLRTGRTAGESLSEIDELGSGPAPANDRDDRRAPFRIHLGLHDPWRTSAHPEQREPGQVLRARRGRGDQQDDCDDPAPEDRTAEPHEGDSSRGWYSRHGVADLPSFLGIPPRLLPRPPVVVEAPAEAEIVERIREFEDHYGVGRLPYWLRYFDRILQAEYEGRMAALAREMRRLDDEARDLADHRVPER